MNAVEIEAAIAELAGQPFDAGEFAFAFLEAFGNKATTIKRLRKGNTNKSDIDGGVLQRNNIHIAVCEPDQVGATLAALANNPQTSKAKAKFVLATDGDTLEAEDQASGETIATDFANLAEHFGFFLPLAGISTVREIKDNPIDVRATGRLNKLYVELLKHNPDWAERRHDMNHFMARLIFCFFAEDTDIFEGEDLFTRTLDTMSQRDASNLAEVIATLFRAMDIQPDDRGKADLPNWAKRFPYVNGQLFSGATDVPRFTKLARSYLIQTGNLDWKAINPDIFGSMIQAVADDDERGSLGMHYTSVPNILKVLNPLFLDDLRQQLAEAGDNARKLLNLRKRMARIRVFDPACGSGNFLVIAYKEMRTIEAEINQRRNETHLKSAIPLTNFRGIELRDFAAEIARLALVIAEYQCDVAYRGQKEALKDVLPLSKDNWITQGNALRLEWLTICPSTGTRVRLTADDLFDSPLDQAEIDFDNDGGETYICGNPPYLGSVYQSNAQKAELKAIFGRYTGAWKSLDYVAGWYLKAAEYGRHTRAISAFVSTNSICQGEQTPILWPLVFELAHQIVFAYRSFKWSNLASHKAGVTVVIIGMSTAPPAKKKLFDADETGVDLFRLTDNISPYLVSGPNFIIKPASAAPDERGTMVRGNMANDGGHLVLASHEADSIVAECPGAAKFIKAFIGSKEFINSTRKYCIWIEEKNLREATRCSPIAERIEKVKRTRLNGGKQARDNAETPHRFVFAPHREGAAIIVPRVSSENRPYLPVGISDGGIIVSERNFVLYDAALWNLALIASRLHWVWIGTVCVRLEMRFSYSNTLGWNTFPVPMLTDQNKTDLTRCAEDILLAREAHFPATIADLYKPDAMPENLRHAHERNDEILERIYIGRRFKNNTERLEKLFALYTEMTTARGKNDKRKERAS